MLVQHLIDEVTPGSAGLPHALRSVLASVFLFPVPVPADDPSRERDSPWADDPPVALAARERAWDDDDALERAFRRAVASARGRASERDATELLWTWRAAWAHARWRGDVQRYFRRNDGRASFLWRAFRDRHIERSVRQRGRLPIPASDLCDDASAATALIEERAATATPPDTAAADAEARALVADTIAALAVECQARGPATVAALELRRGVGTIRALAAQHGVTKSAVEVALRWVDERLRRRLSACS